MGEWQSKKLGDFIKVKHGYAFKGKNITDKETNAILVTPRNFKIGGGFKYSKFKYFNSDYPEDYVLSEGDIVVTMTDLSKESDTLGYSAKIPSINGKVLLHNQRIGLVGFTDNEVSKEYLYWLMRTAEYQWYCVSSASGTSIMHTSPSRIEDYDFKLPPLPEQRAIASVLSSLDDKIDLLHRQNETLEKMAETLFRQWFVEEADEGWEFTSLEKYVTCFNGVSYKSSDLNPSNIAMITLKSFARDGGFRLDGFKEYTGKYKEQHVVNEGDLVVAHTDITQDAALIGNPIMVIGRKEYQTLLISMDLVKVLSNQDWLSNEFLYYQMKSRDFKQHCLGYSNGSTVLHLSKQAVPSYEFFLPPKRLIAEFTSQVKPLIEKSKININHIRNIEELRDTLLPKLMSGEVRVNYV